MTSHGLESSPWAEMPVRLLASARVLDSATQVHMGKLLH